MWRQIKGKVKEVTSGRSSTAATVSELTPPQSPKAWTWTAAAAHPATKLNDSVYELHTPDGEAKMEIVFFHGLRFSDYREAYMETWMSLDGSECWPSSWLREEIPDARILSVSYDSRIQRSSEQGRFDFRSTGESLIKDILYSARVGQGHCPLVLVGHCLGGLIIQQLCVEAEMQLHFNCQESSDQLRVLRSFLQSLKGIFYFATPQKGSRVADYVKNGLRSSSCQHPKLGPVMKYMQMLSSDTEQLVQDFTSCKTKHRWKTAALAETVETKVGRFKGMVVEEASARHGIDSGQFWCIRADHDTICKPEERNSSSFQHLLMFLQRILLEAEHERETMDELQILENIPQHAIGLKSRVRAIESKLENATTVGLYGMGGIGKTTLARAVYDSISSKYQYTSFIPDLRNIVVRDHHRELEKRLLANLRYCGKKVNNEDADMIWISLKGQTVLLVLDDVNSDEHLTRISQLVSVGWFGAGSLVMVTSRDQRFMTDFDVIFEVTELDRQESEELLVRHAFLNQPVPPNLQQYVKKVAKRCSGVPLALEVVGSHLFKVEDEEVWRDTIKRFQSNRERNDRLHSSLMLSYDSLATVEREMFLDIAVLFQNMQIRVALMVEIWNTFWNSGHLGWQNLRRKCLVKEDREGRVWMHEELRHFGRNIACPANSSIQEWTRVGLQAKAEELLRLPEGVGANCKTQGLVIDRWRLNDQQKIQLSQTSFSRMPQLRVLILDEVEVQSDDIIVELPKCLAYLRWANASFVQCPVDFKQLKNMSVLEILHCKNLDSLQEGFELLENLRCLQLEGCAALKELPAAFGKLQKLKALDLRRTGLQKLPDGLGKLRNLSTLQLNETALTRFPKPIIGLKMLKSLDMSQTGLSMLSESFGGLRNLEYLDLSRTALDALPDSIGALQRLKFLSLEKTRIRDLPESFGGLKMLHALHCRETPLKLLPESFQRLGLLKILDLRQTNLTVLPDWVGDLGELLELRLSQTGLKALPDSVCKLKKLQKLHLTCCQKLRTLPESIGELKALDGLSLYGATELENYPDSFGQHLSGVVSLSLQYPSNGLGESAFENAKLQLSTRSSRINLVECGDSGNAGSADEVEEQIEGGARAPRLQSYLSLTRHLKTLSNLVNLNLHGGPTVRQIPVELMSVIEALPVLTRISLHEFNEIEYLPDDFGLYFHKVKVLALRGWRRLRRLPNSVMNMKFLKVLYLVGCPKFEALPENIGNFSKLDMLYLVQCRILESLPSSFGQLHSLEYIYFEDLPNLRSLPDSFGHLKSLQLLHMHECPKLHHLPSSFVKLADSPLSKLFIHDWCILIELMILSDSCSNTYSNITVVYEAECSVMEKVVGRSKNLQPDEFMHVLEVVKLLRHAGASKSSSTSDDHHIHRCDGELESLSNPKFNLKVMCIGAKIVSIATDVQVAFCDQDLQPVLDLYSLIWAGCDSLVCPKNHGAILIEGEGISDESGDFMYTDPRSTNYCEEPNVVSAESWLKRKIESIQTDN